MFLAFSCVNWHCVVCCNVVCSDNVSSAKLLSVVVFVGVV